MADESDEEVVEDDTGLSRVDDADIPEDMPRPEKSADGDQLPEETRDLVPDEGEADEGEPDADPEPGSGTGDEDGGSGSAAGDGSSEPGSGDEDDADSSDGLTKIDPEDRDRDPGARGERPDTTGPDSADEMPPPERGVKTPYRPPDDADADPQPGHAAGAPRPGESSPDEGTTAGADTASSAGGEAESTVGAEVDPEVKSKLDQGVEEVEPPSSVADPAEELGSSPIAEPDYDSPDYDEAWDTTPREPPDDEEMPLADHVEEMVQRFGVVLLTIAVGTAVSFIAAEFVLMAMWNGLIPIDSSPHIYGPLEKILAEIKVASLGGILIGLPVLVYESYLFMRPGLYPQERRYYLAAVPTSLVLGGIGMLFAYFLVLPVIFQYFIAYSDDGVDLLAFGLQVTFDLIVTLLWAFALVFQIPLLIMLAIMMGVTSREWLESKRLYFWGGFAGVGFFLGGIDPTSVAGMIIAVTMILLFEGTLAVLRWAQGDLPWRDRGATH